MRRLTAVALMCLAVAPWAPATGSGRGTAEVPAQPAIALNRVVVLVLENRSWGQIMGTPAAPYLNRLARRGALATRYYAITHPSLPNYLALTTGGYKHVTGDCTLCRSSSRSLANQLEARDVSWRAYLESLRNPRGTTAVAGAPYNPHYNPFASTAALRAPDPLADVTSFASLWRDLSHRTLPRFAWIAPNVWHDGHNGSIASVDRFARRIVPKIVRALGPRSALFITWDEGRRSGTVRLCSSRGTKAGARTPAGRTDAAAAMCL